MGKLMTQAQLKEMVEELIIVLEGKMPSFIDALEIRIGQGDCKASICEIDADDLIEGIVAFGYKMGIFEGGALS